MHVKFLSLVMLHLLCNCPSVTFLSPNTFQILFTLSCYISCIVTCRNPTQARQFLSHAMLLLLHPPVTCHTINTRQIPVTCHVTPPVPPVTFHTTNTLKIPITPVPPITLLIPTHVYFLSLVMFHLLHSPVTFHTTNTHKIPVTCHVTPPSFHCHIHTTNTD
jgi:hypothetical protein